MSDTIERLTAYYQKFIGIPLSQAQEATTLDFSEPAQAGLQRVQAGIADDGNIACFRLTLKDGTVGEVTEDGFEIENA